MGEPPFEDQPAEIDVIVSVLLIFSQLVITLPNDVSGVRIINAAVWCSEAKHDLVKESEPMLRFGWPPPFFRTGLDSTSDFPEVKKELTKCTRPRFSPVGPFPGDPASRLESTARDHDHPGTPWLSVNHSSAFKSSAPLPHFALLLVNY